MRTAFDLQLPEKTEVVARWTWYRRDGRSGRRGRRRGAGGDGEVGWWTRRDGSCWIADWVYLLAAVRSSAGRSTPYRAMCGVPSSDSHSVPVRHVSRNAPHSPTNKRAAFPPLFPPLFCLALFSVVFCARLVSGLRRSVRTALAAGVSGSSLACTSPGRPIAATVSAASDMDRQPRLRHRPSPRDRTRPEVLILG